MQGEQARIAAADEARADTPVRARSLAAALTASRVDAAIVVSITLVAAVLRFWHIGTVPLGLHGDEAWTGIDARRVLHEGWIGPYLPSAVGQPIGPLYFTALLFKFMPETTTTIRVSMALFGVATIPLAYLAFASMFNRTVAAFASLLLAVMMWHLHLARTGFMVVSWPFIEMAILLALWQAMQRRSLRLFALAGALTGLGVYSYNAFLLFIPVPFIAMAWAYVPRRSGVPWRRLGLFVAVFALAGAVVSIPMVLYIYDHGHTYRLHQKLVSVTNSDEWKQAGAGGKADILWDRAREWERGLVEGDRADLGDGLATKGHPVVDPITLVLALLGIGMAVWNWRKPASAVLIGALLILPWGALLTVLDGLYRRTFGLAPFIAVLAALPLGWLWQFILKRRYRMTPVYLGAVLLVPAFVGVITTREYFGPVPDTAAVRFVYPYQLDAASRYMASLPKGTYVYFWSERWSLDYETRRFLAPDVEGIDRSREFGAGDADEFAAQRDRDVAFVFLGPYVNDLDKVTSRYPGGTVTEGMRGEEVTFRAYYVPKE